MNQQERVINLFNIKGESGVSSLEISQRLYIASPHSVIRDIRKNDLLKTKYGIESITDEWRTSFRKEYNGKGEEVKVSVRYKQYFLNKMAV